MTLEYYKIAAEHERALNDHPTTGISITAADGVYTFYGVTSVSIDSLMSFLSTYLYINLEMNTIPTGYHVSLTATFDAEHSISFNAETLNITKKGED